MTTRIPQLKCAMEPRCTRGAQSSKSQSSHKLTKSTANFSRSQEKLWLEPVRPQDTVIALSGSAARHALTVHFFQRVYRLVCCLLTSNAEDLMRKILFACAALAACADNGTNGGGGG